MLTTLNRYRSLVAKVEMLEYVPEIATAQNALGVPVTPRPGEGYVHNRGIVDFRTQISDI